MDRNTFHRATGCCRKLLTSLHCCAAMAGHVCHWSQVVALTKPVCTTDSHQMDMEAKYFFKKCDAKFETEMNRVEHLMRNPRLLSELASDFQEFLDLAIELLHEQDLSQHRAKFLTVAKHQNLPFKLRAKQQKNSSESIWKHTEVRQNRIPNMKMCWTGWNQKKWNKVWIFHISDVDFLCFSPMCWMTLLNQTQRDLELSQLQPCGRIQILKGDVSWEQVDAVFVDDFSEMSKSSIRDGFMIVSCLVHNMFCCFWWRFFLQRWTSTLGWNNNFRDLELDVFCLFIFFV